jgi:hypothetical protein
MFTLLSIDGPLIKGAIRVQLHHLSLLASSKISFHFLILAVNKKVIWSDLDKELRVRLIQQVTSLPVVSELVDSLCSYFLEELIKREISDCF